MVLLLLVGVGVVYFAGFSHEVFEILPRDASGKVFHDQSVVGPTKQIEDRRTVRQRN